MDPIQMMDGVAAAAQKGALRTPRPRERRVIRHPNPVAGPYAYVMEHADAYGDYGHYVPVYGGVGFTVVERERDCRRHLAENPFTSCVALVVRTTFSPAGALLGNYAEPPPPPLALVRHLAAAATSAARHARLTVLEWARRTHAPGLPAPRGPALSYTDLRDELYAFHGANYRHACQAAFELLAARSDRMREPGAPSQPEAGWL